MPAAATEAMPSARSGVDGDCLNELFSASQSDSLFQTVPEPKLMFTAAIGKLPASVSAT